jgi:hypothetical protein
LLDALERWRRNEERDRASQTDSGEVGIEE